MLKEFRKYISDNNLIKSGDKVLLGVSGGIDSMVMTHLFLQAGYQIGIAHCNFSLRGGESDKDEEMVRKYTTENNIPFYSIRFDTKGIAEKTGLSVQMAARELRYNWFEEIRNQNNFDQIAVGHNLNDNTETIMINLVRGTGIKGLTGMRPSAHRIIRPLLFTTRQEIVKYCMEHKIIFREDKSNAETKYTRNKIRHLVIPVLKEINPSIEATLNETAERFSEVDQIVSEYIKETDRKISEKKGNASVFNISQLKTLIHNKTIIYELFSPYGLSGLLLNDLLKIINGRTGRYILTPTHRIIKNRKELIVSPHVKAEEVYYEIGNIEDFSKVPVIKAARFTNVTGDFAIPSDNRFAYLDAQKIAFPLAIRKWRAGDYFYPLGMKGKKKLSDYFTDKKYSIPEKEKALIIESAGDILWIIGERIDDRFRITDHTRRIMVLEAYI